MSTDNRPLSPHLQVYRWQWTMAYSILHRATGIALSVGTVILVWWLIALATGPEAFDFAQSILGSIIGQLALLGWTFSMFYHLGNGVRHLVWDSGYGFDLQVAAWTGHAVPTFAVLMTAIAWAVGYLALS
ncbi:MAG: succinate dehydrogenase, cytochrome b556 subunit [Pseudomonadota bacterium]